VAGAALALAIMLVPAILATGSTQAQTYSYSLLYSFTGPPDGAAPSGGVPDAQGNLYGTTGYGGDSACYPPYGCGTVFKLDTTGKETVLYSFTGTGGDGEGPNGGLVLDAKGNLYGTTEYGGDLSCNAPDGCGTVFKFDTTTGKETVLYSFTGSPDASQPHGGLVEDAQGNLYGTAPDTGADGYGAVYKVNTADKETVLYSFTGGADGGNPTEKLVRDAQGNLYGTTFDNNNGAYGGTVFELSPEPGGGCPSGSNVGTGWCETVLHSFTGTGGGSPQGDLIRDTQGNLYGTTKFGGDLTCDAPNGCGTVFKLAPPVAPSVTWTETVLYTWPYSSPYGATGGLSLRDAKGNLYGIAGAGGDLACNAPNGCGTVFKLAPPASLSGLWTETALYTFTNEADGYGPGGLILDAQGDLYGGTVAGGDLACTTGPVGKGATLVGCGTVFKLTPPTATTTTLTSSLNPSTYGQAVTSTAEVTSKAGTPPDGGTVSFMKGTTVLGTGTLSGGSASFTTSTLKVGANAIKAVYAGDSNFASSTSKAVSQVVDKATTTTTLASSQNPSNFGQSVTFTATVAPQFSGTPTGTVTFNNGTTKLGTVSLSGGVASYKTTKLAVGTESITAVYDGSISFTTSTSNALSQAVNQASTTTTLVSSLNPSTYKQAVTFTATVSPQFSGTVTGTVSFYDGATLLKTVALSGDKAKFTTAKLTAGAHSITATYNGSTDFTGSSSAPLPQTVN